MVHVDDLQKDIERIAPLSFAMDWDNSGFQVNLHNKTKGVLLCLDVTEEIIMEAAEREYGLIVAHHPLLFNSINKIDALDYHGQCIKLLIENNISLYSAHTSADCAPRGINAHMADIIGLKDQVFLTEMTKGEYFKVGVTIPSEDADKLRQAMAESGAGVLGDYTGCSFSVEGMGTFMPGEEAAPHIGKKNIQEYVDEVWIQVLVSRKSLQPTLQAIRNTHPYEEPAIDVFPLEEPYDIVSGLGIIGNLREDKKISSILESFKKALDIDSVRLKGIPDQKVQRIAICGGSGGSCIPAAETMGAQLFITGEVKHNEYLETNIALVEAGHHDSEKCFCSLMQAGLQKAPSAIQYNLEVRISEKMRRPFMNY